MPLRLGAVQFGTACATDMGPKRFWWIGTMRIKTKGQDFSLVSYKFLLGSFSTWFPQDSCIKFPKRPQVGSAHPLSGNYAPFFFLNSRSLGKRQIACYMPCPFSWRIQSWIAKRTILVGTLMQKHAKAIGVMPASQIVSHPNSCWIMIAKGNHPANCSSVG